MMKRIAWKFAASGLVLGVTTFGCMVNGVGTAPASASQSARSDQQAARLHQQAGRAIAENRLSDAIGLLEEAVALSPRDAGYRLLLADAYMKSGRFQSAEATYRDVLTLDPSQTRAGIALALMQVANGQQQAAVAQLERLEGNASAADLGLAYALAGAPQRAVELLEPAARAMGATPRVRQNLALAYAFGGDWERARTIAAQDVAPSDLASRLSNWASLAPRAGSTDPVAALLGVAPVADAGQPVRIALNAPPQRVQMAAADPAPLQSSADLPVPAASVAAAPQPLAWAEAQPSADSAPAPVPAPVPAQPAQMDYAELEAPEWGIDEDGKVELPAEEPAAERLPARIQYAAAAEALVRPDPVVMPVASRAARAVAPVATRAFSAAPLPGTRAAAGRFVVQIGAFSSAANAERAWRHYEERFNLSAEQPVTMTLDHRGRLLHRVAISGFAKRGDATQVCQAIKARGGECFVRTNAGDAAINWAARYSRNG